MSKLGINIIIIISKGKAKITIKILKVAKVWHALICPNQPSLIFARKMKDRFLTKKKALRDVYFSWILSWVHVNSWHRGPSMPCWQIHTSRMVVTEAQTIEIIKWCMFNNITLWKWIILIINHHAKENLYRLPLTFAHRLSQTTLYTPCFGLLLSYTVEMMLFLWETEVFWGL